MKFVPFMLSLFWTMVLKRVMIFPYAEYARKLVTRWLNMRKNWSYVSVFCLLSSDPLSYVSVPCLQSAIPNLTSLFLVSRPLYSSHVICPRLPSSFLLPLAHSNCPSVPFSVALSTVPALCFSVPRPLFFSLLSSVPCLSWHATSWYVLLVAKLWEWISVRCKELR